MAYTVLARKYRPQTFSDLVGQEHVTRTLENAIKSGRVAHAFLFTGVRGVGKTTTARILAKALNCERGPTPEPCDVCDICVSITAGRDTDVLEMDGASNNSVEDVRRLQESIPYRPQRDRFKVVIVDEVHMLSTGAFNAFLKTLEEPPEHVKFIFATTESHKVPVTIRSRCQRYDFRLIPQSVVSRAVRAILTTESVAADDAAVAIVAREAAGSMRDALTLLDQIMAFGGADLVGQEVARVLGIAGRDMIHRVAAAVLDGDGAEVLRQVDQLASNGLDMLHFSRQLLELVRDMVVLQVGGADTDLVALVDEERTRALEASSRVDLQELQRAFSGLAKTVEDVAQSGMPQTTLEMGLVRLATRPPLLPLAELVARLDELEKKGGGGPRGGGGPARGTGAAGSGRSAGGRAPGAAQADAPRRTEASPQEQRPQAQLPQEQRPQEQRPQEQRAQTEPDAAARAAAAWGFSPKDGAANDGAANDDAAGNDIAKDIATVAVAPKGIASRGIPGASAMASRARDSARPAPEPARSERSRTPAAADENTTSEAASAQDDTLDLVAWERIVAAVMDGKPALGAVLQHGTPIAVNPSRVALSFPIGSFFGRQAEALDGRKAIGEMAARVLGGRPEVEVTYDGAGQATGAAKPLVQVEQDRRDARIEEARTKALNHPLVMHAVELFSLSRESMHIRVEQD